MPGSPKLYLIPTPLGKTPANNSVPADVIRIIHKLDTFFVESLPSARKFLQWVDHPIPEYELKLYLLNKKSTASEIHDMLQVVIETGSAGMFSEAGAPAVADPGAQLVHICHTNGITVHPLVGPSSVVLALMASGCNGQQFTFHGYLPREPESRKQAISRIEKNAGSDGYTHLFMETPYRNADLWDDLLATLKPDTVLGYGQNLTLPSEQTTSKEVMMWQADMEKLSDDPAIFFMYRKKSRKPDRRQQSGGKKPKTRKRF